MKKISITILIIIFVVLATVVIIGIFISINSIDDNIKDSKDILLESFNESVVVRSFSSRTFSQGEQIDVMLDVYFVEGETYYAVEEFIPEGWVVIDDAGGATGEPNRLAWVAFDMLNTLPNITITYTVQAPYQVGSHNFDGIYQFEGMSSSSTTKGSTTVTVN